MASKHYLPSKLPSYFRRLMLEYERAGRDLDLEILRSARVAVIEETAYDNWNGGTYGHDVLLFLPEEVMSRLPFADQQPIAQRLRDDLQACAASVENEHFANVVIELADDIDPTFQRAIALSKAQPIPPESASFWQEGHLRLFISHRDTHKAAARAFANALRTFGVSAFVAHDTIEPMSSWQREIEKGLATMEIMLAFVTDDFHESIWTNQEIGYALGKGIPIVSVKLGKHDPAGFIGEKQAIRSDINKPDEMARSVLRILVDNLGQKERLRDMIVASFASSRDWSESRDRFNIMQSFVQTITTEQFERIQESFRRNSALHGSYYLTNQNRRLHRFLEKATGNNIRIDQGDISVVAAQPDDDIPF